jgi:hypothetical protein
VNHDGLFTEREFMQVKCHLCDLATGYMAPCLMATGEVAAILAALTVAAAGRTLLSKDRIGP